MELGPIDWEDFKEAFLRKYFPRVRGRKILEILLTLEKVIRVLKNPNLGESQGF